jgi:subtilisin
MLVSLEEQLNQNGSADVLVLLKRGVEKREVERRFLSIATEGSTALPNHNPDKSSFFPGLGVLARTIDRQGLAALRSDGTVDRVIGPVRYRHVAPQKASWRIFPGIRRLFAAVSAAEWGIVRLGIAELWDRGYKGEGITVGHLDTGIDGEHEALRDALRVFVSVDDQGQVTPHTATLDSDGHGTHTAGTIAGRKISGKPAVGVAPKAQLASAMIIGRFDGNVPGETYPIARLVGGLQWAMSQGVHAINLSIALEGDPDDLKEFTKVISDVHSAGILLACAAGNSGENTSVAPGNYQDAVAVGACRHNFGVWPSSASALVRPGQNDPQVPDFVAPGQEIRSTWPENSWKVLEGTSMATAYISGLAALLMQAALEAGRTAKDVQQAIFDSCQRGSLTEARANRGIPHPLLALSILRPDLNITPGTHPVGP